MRHTMTLAALVALAGCAQSPCTQPDVLAFVDQARQSHDLYAIGLTADTVGDAVASPVQETPMTLPGLAVVDRDAAVCSAWMLSRNPAFRTGNGQPQYVRERQDFKVVKLATGYEVSPYRFAYQP